MATFSIQRGATPLCTLELSSNELSFHPAVGRSGDVLVVGESDQLQFALSPSPEDQVFRISIGDVPLSDLMSSEDASGMALGGQHFWKALTYFESARGNTRVTLEYRHGTEDDAPWVFGGSIEVFVHPSKLGERRYEAMAEDLQAVSRSLLVDLYGKSRQSHDVRYAKEGKVHSSREQELVSIMDVLANLSDLLETIAKRPASRVTTETAFQRYWGGERLSPANLTALARNGVAQQRGDVPVVLRIQRKRESFDVPEHRVIRAFLDIIIRRAQYCASAAVEHIQAVESDKHLRHVRLYTKQETTLYESIDLPKIRRLQAAAAKADRAEEIAGRLAVLPFLREAKPELVPVRDGVFQRNAEYAAVFELIRRFLLANAVWYQGNEVSTITKLTSRLFEQWCYLRLINAFRAGGIELREWTDKLRENLRSRFLVDFDRGLTFEGALTSDLRLRFRYEPWILGTESAAKSGETLCRGSNIDVAWSPDIVIECLKDTGNNWQPVYAVVLDCKYTPKLRDVHWNDTAKYRQIRCTKTRNQVVKHLCLISPAGLKESGYIRSDDPYVDFADAGPTCPPQDAVGFHLAVVPTGEPESTSEDDVFQQFATGMMSYLRRNFGPA